MAKSALRRQTPEVRAVCIKVHVRIRAGGVGQLTSLPRPSRNIDGTFKQTGWRFRQGNFLSLRYRGADDVAGRMRMLTRARSCVALVDRVDLATPLSLSSQPLPLSVLAPAQRAGAQRLRA